MSLLDDMIESLESSAPASVEATPKLELSDELVHALLADDDGICSNPECWRCHSPLSPENLRTLARNLAAAGMLCRAWQMRGDDPAWHPGCNLKGAAIR